MAIIVNGVLSGSSGGSVVKNPPTSAGDAGWSLGWEDPLALGEEEDPLKKEMATHSSILAWKISRPEEPGGLYSPWGHKESWQLSNENNSNSYTNGSVWGKCSSGIWDLQTSVTL